MSTKDRYLSNHNYYLKNREKILCAVKNYRENNLDKIKETERAYYLKNRKERIFKASLKKDYWSRRRKERRHALGISKQYIHEPRAHKSRYRSHGKEYCGGWLELRKKIYERDFWTCQECKIKCHGNGTKDKIQCHHIDYDITNNELSNLITLCASCHAKTNFNKVDLAEYLKRKVKN
jgi:5-methylcytosine-specific restriction endonuclease McrA